MPKPNELTEESKLDELEETRPLVLSAVSEEFRSSSPSFLQDDDRSGPTRDSPLALAAIKKSAPPPEPNKAAPPKAPKKTIFTRLNDFIDGMFEPARTANALGNGAISASAVQSNGGLLVLGLVTGMINSYASGEARETNRVNNAPPLLWWADRIISMIYGLGCGLTTAASAHQIFSAISLLLGGIWGIVGFGLIIGTMTFISSRSKLGSFYALLLAGAVITLYIGIGLALVSFANPLLLGPILFASTYFLSITMGFCTTILNYGITQDSIISLVMHDKATREKEEAKTLERSAQEKFNFRLLWIIAALSCFASGIAIGGLTYISIMMLPAAFGFTMPFVFMLTASIFVATVTTAAMIPLLIKQCSPIAEAWARVALADVPALILKQLKTLVVFDKSYKDTPWNRLKFYARSSLLVLIVPLAIVGSVLTMLQASSALAQVIKDIFQAIPISAAEGLAYGTLGGALGSDLVFSITTTVSWMKGSQEEQPKEAAAAEALAAPKARLAVSSGGVALTSAATLDQKPPRGTKADLQGTLAQKQRAGSATATLGLKSRKASVTAMHGMFAKPRAATAEAASLNYDTPPALEAAPRPAAEMR